jgi:hypothetical protein
LVGDDIMSSVSLGVGKPQFADFFPISGKFICCLKQHELFKHRSIIDFMFQDISFYPFGDVLPRSFFFEPFCAPAARTQPEGSNVRPYDKPI